ncbi:MULTISPECIES: hypothetical protein [unclassified Rhodococcus (in: high G+C Gram-positive bacteria)]|uniref:hypothetical protein n=1 Tax=unclassified Rhodococcus (in: high G+C Gram-positive bacteria) TaxID=192944 RepID=UPI00163A439A|nr:MULTISPECIES: hypothetical protein [unclassified Rhodococcus (in: high G+C Gram-positive bacteria)]MBC2640628.1 hypothetical protein [Rhodococcus sp. 3A]
MSKVSESAHQWLEPWVAEIHTVVGRQQYHSVEVQGVERVLDLTDGSGDVVHGQNGEPPKRMG